MGVQGPFPRFWLWTQLLPADSPLVFLNPASNRVSKTHSAGTDRGRVRVDREQERVDRGLRMMPLGDVGWLLTPPRLQLCPLLEQRAGRGYLLGLRSPQLESLHPSLELSNGAGPSPVRVLASADLWTAV